MPELHNKMELLKERIGPLLRLLGPCLQIHFYLTHAGQQEANQNAGIEDIIDAEDSEKEDESAQDCFVLPIWPSYSSTITHVFTTDDKREEEQVFMDELERLKRQEKEAHEEAEDLRKKFETLVIQEGAAKTSSTNIFSTVSTPAKASSTNLVNTVSIPVSTASPHEGLSLSDPQFQTQLIKRNDSRLHSLPGSGAKN
ncbi:hypothetical protein Tco_0160119 [Tanacetum coccineum]